MVVEGVDKWGRRTLVSPVRKFMEADHILTRFKLMAESVKELETDTSALSDVLRYLVAKGED